MLTRGESLNRISTANLNSVLLQELLSTLLSELFPCRSIEGVLKSRVTLVGIMKQIPKNAVVRNSKLPTIIYVTVRHMNDFDTVSEDRQTVGFQQMQSNQLVRLPVYAKDGVDRSIERNNFLFDAAAKPRTTF